MSEPPGVQPALGIETVEWVASAGERLTVRVAGRWLRRPAAPRGQAMLVVAAEGARHRFPAMPEPPSLGGTPPGVWRVSFSLPAWLAPYLSHRLTLQIGGVVVPLPGARSMNLEDAPADVVFDAAEPEDPGHDAGEERATVDQLAANEARVRELERELAELQGARDFPVADDRAGARSVTGGLRHELELAHEAPAAPEAAPVHESTEPRGLRGEREMLAIRPRYPQLVRSPDSRTAEAQADAERQSERLQAALDDVRRELEDRTESEARLANTAAALRRELEIRSVAEARLRAELGAVQGSLDARAAIQTEAETRAAALVTELAGLQSELAEARAQLTALGGARDEAQAEVLALRTEIETLKSELSAAHEVSRQDAAALANAETLLAEAHQLAADAEARLTVEHERASEAIAAQERLEREFAEYRLRSLRVHAAIEELRRQLAALRGARESGAEGVVEPPAQAGPPEPAAPEPAPPGPAAPEPAAPEPTPVVEPAPEPTPVVDPAGEVEPGRLTEALSRLRERAYAPDVAAPPPDEATEPVAPAVADDAATAPRSRKSWLKPVLRRLTAEAAETAGQIILELLPAQRAVDPRAVSYDLVLGERDCLRVTVGETVQIERAHAPRELSEVAFRVTGDRASLARLVTAGRLRRRFGRRLPKIAGNRRAVAALRALGRAELGLRELHEAGVRLDAPLSLELVAAMIKPGWTSGERFTVAHELGAAHAGATYLHVRDGSAPTVSAQAPLGPVATTVVCSAEALLLLLAGERPADVVVRGDERPLAQCQQWINRAQSG